MKVVVVCQAVVEHPKEDGGKKVCGKQSTVFWGPSWALRTGGDWPE